MVAGSFNLSQNFPNPFNPTTNIRFSIPNSALTTLKVYNMVGQEVATLVNGQKEAGVYFVDFDASKLASGVYLYKLQSGSYVETKKMVLVK
ncbi:MAG: T9SS type A sorting domain-containing protein [Bacteroidetes bacterium]|nr:T9SS type A sorting domain-containing protein [Bacteroidota bacterium]